MSSLPFVSAIIPCRNEESFIGACLESIVRNTYPNERLEVLVVDGMSQDDTRIIVGSYLRSNQFIHLLDNPRRITAAALNIGIAAARGEIIIRMDAHATYDREYVSKSVNALLGSGADSVGGVWNTVPRTEGIFARGIARALSHRFGIGNTHYRLGRARNRMWVDTVPFFCCRREVFRKIGLFNEELVRGQDMEFNLRIKKAGGRVLLVPDIVSYYYARSDMKSFVTHNWNNGVWAIMPFLYSDVIPVSPRHLIPLAFISSLIGLAASSLVWPMGWLGAVGILATYAGISVVASAHVAVEQRDYRYLVVMPFAFAGLHFAYGLGSVWGSMRVLCSGRVWKVRCSQLLDAENRTDGQDSEDGQVNYGKRPRA